MGEFVSLFNSWLATRRTKKSIDNIKKDNELRKNITRYEPSDIEGFIERDHKVGSYVISGGEIKNRAKVAASVATCSLKQGVPTVVLHEGNIELQNEVSYATAFSSNNIIITNSTTIYDPFYNRNNQEICNLILNSGDSNININATARQYIIGITDFIKSKNILPFCDMFVSCPFDTLLEKIDDSEKAGYISVRQASQIRNQLMQGQSEKARVQSFFSQLAYQGAGVLSNKGSRGSAVNVKEAVSHNGMIMIDIGSSENKILLNLLINEIKEVIVTGKKMMLIIDGININSNELLSSLTKSMSSRCLTTILSKDIYSMLGADDNLFHSFVGNACKCIVFSHVNGVTCNKWSEVFGYYDVNKVSQTIGGNQNYQWGYGFSSQNSINVSTNRDFIVKPEEIARMNCSEVYILDRNFRELAFTTIR